MSPNYPALYTHHVHCVWVITVAEGEKILLNISHINIEDHSNCLYDYLEASNLFEIKTIFKVIDNKEQFVLLLINNYDDRPVLRALIKLAIIASDVPLFLK